MSVQNAKEFRLPRKSFKLVNEKHALPGVPVEPRMFIICESVNIFVAEGFVDERRLAGARGTDEVVARDFTPRSLRKSIGQFLEPTRVPDPRDGVFDDDETEMISTSESLAELGKSSSNSRAAGGGLPISPRSSEARVLFAAVRNGLKLFACSSLEMGTVSNSCNSLSESETAFELDVSLEVASA